MKRFRVPLLAALALVVLLVPASASAKPGTPPPNVAGTTSEPPPAWYSVGAPSWWLAYGSFCWTTACVDFLPPARRTDLPRVKARVGQNLGIHLGFDPRSVRVRVLATSASYPLVARRNTVWRIRASGLIVIETRGAKGTASYLARIVAG